MRPSVRACYQHPGYTYATRAEEIARQHGFTRVARLASNENPFPLSAKGVELAGKALAEAHRYPPEQHASLLAALQHQFGYEHIVVGNGMDGVIETVVRALINPRDRVVIAQPTFSFYRVAAAGQAAHVIPFQRRDDFSLDAQGFIEACWGAQLAFLCTPNNPTANTTPISEVKTILEETDCILFLDNAYIEFADSEYQHLISEYDRLIIGRTMSKAYSMAGLRLGYAFIPPWFEAAYHNAATPFAVNRVTAAAAEGALTDHQHVQTIVNHVRTWRTRFLASIKFNTFLSQANFVLVDVAPYTGDQAMEHLASRGVLVRSCTSFPGLGDHYIRVSIGADWENELFLQEINAL